MHVETAFDLAAEQALMRERNRRKPKAPNVPRLQRYYKTAPSTCVTCKRVKSPDLFSKSRPNQCKLLRSSLLLVQVRANRVDRRPSHTVIAGREQLAGESSAILPNVQQSQGNNDRERVPGLLGTYQGSKANRPKTRKLLIFRRNRTGSGIARSSRTP